MLLAAATTGPLKSHLKPTIMLQLCIYHMNLTIHQLEHAASKSIATYDGGKRKIERSEGGARRIVSSATGRRYWYRFDQ